MTILTTKRLILRPWQEKDIAAFAKMNADPRVMEFFPAVKSFNESAEEYARIVDNFSRHGWGLWAAEVPGVADFIGFIGLHYTSFPAHFTPCVEIGWRLDYDHWGKGYATEGATACLKTGFEEHKLDEIVSFTATTNLRSQAVMQKIGMHRAPADDFDHPKLAVGHPLCRHVLYRMNKHDWSNTSSCES